MATLTELIKAFLIFVGLLKAADAEIKQEIEEQKIDDAVKSRNTDKLDSLF